MTHISCAEDCFAYDWCAGFQWSDEGIRICTLLVLPAFVDIIDDPPDGYSTSDGPFVHINHSDSSPNTLCFKKCNILPAFSFHMTLQAIHNECLKYGK